MSPVVTESRQPIPPRTQRDKDQPRPSPVCISLPVSNNAGPNPPSQTAVGQLTYHRASSVAVQPDPNDDGHGHRPPLMHPGPIQHRGS